MYTVPVRELFRDIELLCYDEASTSVCRCIVACLWRIDPMHLHAGHNQVMGTHSLLILCLIELLSFDVGRCVWPLRLLCWVSHCMLCQQDMVGHHMTTVPHTKKLQNSFEGKPILINTHPTDQNKAPLHNMTARCNIRRFMFELRKSDQILQW